MIHIRAILFALLIAAPGSAAAVDTITLKDGSVLKGKIKSVNNDELKLDTEYADDVFIEVEHIANIDTDQHYTVRLHEGEKISGYLTFADGKIVMHDTPLKSSDPEAAALPQEIDPAVPQLIPVTTPDSADAPREFTFDDVDWIDEKLTYLRYDAELNVGIQVSDGNTDTSDFHFDGRFEPTFGWNTLRFEGNFDKKEADGDTTTNRWLFSMEYEREIRRRWFIGAANSYEADKQRDLDLRIIGAAGVGYRFFDDPTPSSLTGFEVKLNFARHLTGAAGKARVRVYFPSNLYVTHSSHPLRFHYVYFGVKPGLTTTNRI